MRRTLLPSLLSTRSVVLFGAMLIALALIVLALVGTSAKPAEAATRIVTKTFSNQGQILIPAGAVPGSSSSCSTGPTVGSAAPYPSQKTASFPRGSHIRDVNLVLKNYSHSFPIDVDVLLGHKGVNRTVMSDVGGGAPGINNVTLKLDDEASTHLPASQIVAGTFKPTNTGTADNFSVPAPLQDSRSALRGFDGNNPLGTWNLFVQDDENEDCGAFAGGWSITIKAAVPS